MTIIQSLLAKLLLSSFALTVLSCFVPASKADEPAQPPRIVVEATMATGDAIALPITEELRPGRSLPSGTLGLRARVNLSWADQDVLAERTGLLVQKTDPTSISLKPTSDNPGSPTYSTGDLLGYDQLWVDYDTDLTQRQCVPTATLRASGVDRLEKNKPALTLDLRTAQAGMRSQQVNLSGGRILPRNNLYLIRRQTGVGSDPDWRVVQDQQNLVYMRLLRLDLRNVEMLELEMSPNVQHINFRLSQDSRGRPTDVLTWDDLPKEIRDTGHSKVVRLYMGEVLQQRFAETLQNDKPLSLVEVIAFVAADKMMAHVDESLTAPVTAARVFRREKKGATHAKTVFLPSETERTGPGNWRWKVNLAPLQALDLREARLIDGQFSIVPTFAEQTCTANIRQVSLVGLFKKRQPTVFAEINRTTRQWGGPFGIAAEGDDKLEWPHVLAQLPFREIRGQQKEKVKLYSGQEHLWPDLGFSLKSAGDQPGIATLDSRGLSVTAADLLEARWRVAAKLPEHTYLLLELGSNDGLLPPGSLALDFTDGSDNIAYFPGQTTDLGKYAGRQLRQVTFRLPLDPVDKSIVLREAVLFSVTALAPHQALQTAEPGWHWLPTATLAMAQPETQMSSGDIIQTHPLHEQASNFAALRLRYDISQPPRDACWLGVTLHGMRQSAHRRLCLHGYQGEQVIPYLDITSHGFNADETLRAVEWTVYQHALTPGGSARLEIEHAVLNRPSLADRLRSNVQASVSGRTLPPPSLPEGFWHDLSHGRAWLNFDDIAWASGDFAPRLHAPALSLQVTEWRVRYRDGDAQRILDELRNDTSSGGTDSKLEKLLVAALITLLMWLIVLRWRAGTIQRAGSSLSASLGALWRRSITSSAVLGAGLAEFVHDQRRLLNIVMLGLVWWLTLRHYLQRPYLTTLDMALLGLGLATLLGLWHEWRWRIGERRFLLGTTLNRWLVGSRYRPPRLLWLVAIIVLTAIFINIIGSSVKLGYLHSLLEITQELSVADLAYFIAGALVQLGISVATVLRDVLWWPLVLALLYGFLPWLAAWGSWLFSPAGHALLWTLIALFLYAIGTTQLGRPGENYYYTFGGIAVLLAWRGWLVDLRPRIERRWPKAGVIYDSAGGLYFSGALIGLVLTALLLIPRWGLLAEQTAVVVYYFLVVGLIVEVLDQRRRKSAASGNTTASSAIEETTT